MADAALGVLFENLNSLIQREFGLLWGVQIEMNKLSGTLSTIRAVLKDAEVRQVKDEAIRDWLRKLKDAAYDADDILDEWSTEFLLTKSDSSSKSYTEQVRAFFLSGFGFKTLAFGYKIAKRIKGITEKFNEIAKAKSDFNLIEAPVQGFTQLDQSRKTSSVPHEPKIYGRELDNENMMSLLLNSQWDICICPIVGIGGLGKTTLAQVVYNDERIEEHFEKRMWICVSENFDVQRLTKEIIESLSGSSCNDLLNLDVMQRRLKEMVTGKRFLLVLDDVWNDNQDEWNKLKSPLLGGAKGSAIIVTTRRQNVSSITGTIPAHHLNSLSQNDCWNLFRYYAFGMGNEEKPNLAKIGHEIVQKCNGVPLAAKALGSLLRFKSEEREWKMFRDSEIWELEKDGENQILPALRLSYNNLPIHLRQCFAYCSIYPKDFRMYKSELIHLWMANGFIQSNGGMTLEHIGDGIFNELMWHSLFQDIEEDVYGNIITCKMHDLLHDLAASVMGEECQRVGIDEEKSFTKKIRHLSFIWHSKEVPSHLDQLPSSQTSLRSLLLLSNHRRAQHQMFNPSHLKCLRVLSLPNVEMATLPPSMAKFKHLRYLDVQRCELPSLPNWVGCLRNLQYLDLGCNQFKTLPASIGELEQLRFLNLLSNEKLKLLPESINSLKNLHTLNLQYCYELKVLPKNLRNMSNLKHLLDGGCEALYEMPAGIGELTSLETLELFKVSPNNGGGAGITELQGLNHLRGKLEIQGLERVSDSMDAKAANIINKENLSFLDLSWLSLRYDERLLDDNSVEVLESLQPHSNIRKLHIKWYRGATFPSWMKFEDPTDLSFPRLTEISLSAINIEELPWNWSEEKPPSLTALQRLELSGCWKLKTLPAALMNLTSLRKLSIMTCHSLTSLPKLGMNLKSLYISNCIELEFSADCFEQLIALQTLYIDGCPKLTSLPEGLQHAVALEVLYLRHCKNLMVLPNWMPRLTALRRLEIKQCRELEFSAECFEQLIALQTLWIRDCPKLTSLPDGLQHAVALESLELWDCENLMVLPNWMPCLTALRRLCNRRCHPDLAIRCEKEKGEDWKKISHIPHLVVDSSPYF